MGNPTFISGPTTPMNPNIGSFTYENATTINDMLINGNPIKFGNKIPQLK